jgi:uncharacterized protein
MPTPTEAADTALAKLLEAGRTKLDGWMSAVTGLGMAYADKASSYVFVRPPLLTPKEASDLYHFDDFAHIIVSAVPEDATREGIQVLRQTEQGAAGDDIEVSKAQEQAKLVEDRLVDLDALAATRDAMIWARCMGGAGILGIFDGGGLPDEPLAEEQIKRVITLRVIDREDVSPHTYYREGPKTGYPETYYLNNTANGGVVQATTVIIHESRVIWFRGASTSPKERAQNQGWDHSVLQRAWPVIQQVNSGWLSVIHMMQDMSQAVIKLMGLYEATGVPNGPSVMQARMSILNMVRSVARMLVLDAGTKDTPAESFEVVERSSVTGAAELLDRLFIRLAQIARMPVTRLMGQSPAGLNATGDSDVRWWYDTIRVARQLEIRPRYLRLVGWVAIELGLDVEGWELRFPPLWQMTPKEEAELRQMVAQTDAIYIDKQVALPEEITLSRWGSGQYSPETTVDIEVRKAALAAANEAEQTETQDLGTVGAQTDAILKVVTGVIGGSIPRESGLAILTSRFGITPEEANKMLGPVGYKDPTPAIVPGTAPPIPPKAPGDNGSKV